jgi:hypothetical protein
MERYYDEAGHFTDDGFEEWFASHQFNQELMRDIRNDNADARAAAGTSSPHDVPA